VAAAISVPIPSLSAVWVVFALGLTASMTVLVSILSNRHLFKDLIRWNSKADRTNSTAHSFLSIAFALYLSLKRLDRCLMLGGDLRGDTAETSAHRALFFAAMTRRGIPPASWSPGSSQAVLWITSARCGAYLYYY
jgi:hypothetical protein